VDNRLRALREGAGLSQADCADALGVSRQTVISIEKGHFDPRLSLAFRISRLFAVPVDEVFVPDADAGGRDTARIDDRTGR
jgi:putative transcriptional regulator